MLGLEDRPAALAVRPLAPIVLMPSNRIRLDLEHRNLLARTRKQMHGRTCSCAGCTACGRSSNHSNKIDQEQARPSGPREHHVET